MALLYSSSTGALGATDIPTSAPRTITAYDYFHYTPSLPASIIFAVLYLVAAIIVTIPTLKHGRGTWFVLIVTVTGIAEVIGFIARCYLAQHINDTTISPMGPYVIMSTLLIISPNALALVNYLTLGRLLSIANIENPPFLLRPKVVSSLFLLSDICAFAIQGGASGMLVSKDRNTAHMGQSLMMVGLAVQLGFFSVFTFTNGYVQYSSNYSDLRSKSNVQRILRGLWVTISMLYIRSVFRMIEFGTGFDGPVATDEALMYVFDSVPVLLTFGSYAYDHFGHIKELYLTSTGEPMMGKGKRLEYSDSHSTEIRVAEKV